MNCIEHMGASIIWIQLDRALVFALRSRPVPLSVSNAAEQSVCLSLRVVKSQGTLRGSFRLRKSIARWCVGVLRENDVVFRHTHVRQRVVGVFFDGLLEKLLGLR